MIYVYALADPLAPPQDQPGLGGGALHSTVAGGVCGVYSIADDGAPQATPEHLWQHEAVVERIIDAGAATLPTRFGTVLSDADELNRMLAEQADTIGAALDRVRGLVEVGVRLRLVDPPQASAPTEDPAGETGAGRAYLMRRLEEERRSRERDSTLRGTARRVLAPLDGLAKDATAPTPSRSGEVVSTAYLVAPGDVSAFSAHVASIDAAHDGLELVATGPWPAYSFAPVLTEGTAHV